MDLNPAVVARVDAVFADMARPQHPGAALLVSEHDEIVYRKTYGLADLATGRPITADTSFYLANEAVFAFLIAGIGPWPKEWAGVNLSIEPPATHADVPRTTTAGA